MVIRINGVIGYEITSKDFTEKLDGMSGDVQIEINSPGGLVYDGINIANAMKNYDRGKIHINVSGESSSIASYFMLFGDTLSIEANSSVFLHNPLNLAIGDYQVMYENADMLKRLASVMAKAYAAKTGLPVDEIQTMMDKETYFIGRDQLKVWGNVVGEQDQENEEIQAKARMSVMAMREKIKSQNVDKEQLSALKTMVCALAGEKPPKTVVSNNVVTQNNPIGGKKMDLNELQTQHPDVYAQAIQAGAKLERERVQAHMEFMDVAPQTAAKAIEDGEGFTVALQAIVQQFR